ncbi:Xanthine dehydrogenase [Papilio xuthus]|uniref:Xanthine dehydrogenase n=1 Tax=Papilio xuthus TaxID=66420 RepID=A0A194PHA2_PAPXU|nr:Xanthine dehydrogenase [Papilio xuthus]
MDKFKDIISKPIQTELVFFVNGKKVVESSPDPEWTLLWYLRKKLHLTGTKYGCGEGGCGACTVMVSQYLRNEDHIKHYAVNACLTPVCAMHGLAVTTVEGIGSTHDRLHPVQERIAKAHGSQCGFCTPGIVMSMYALLRNKIKIDYNDLETALQGNLCRCTGYRPIIEGFKTFTEGWEQNYVKNTPSSCAMGKDCCKLKTKEKTENRNLFNTSEFQPYSPSQEPIFPPELKIKDDYTQHNLLFIGENVTWIRPKSLQDLLLLKKEYTYGKIIAGNTEVGIEMKFKNKKYPVLISPMFIKEMNVCVTSKSGVKIGAAVSLTETNNFLSEEISRNKGNVEILEAIRDMLHWFAGNQIRNVATIVGNVITASPISDLNPIFLASSSKLYVSSYLRGEREIIIDTNFFEGYRKVALKEDEVVTAIEIPFTKEKQFFKAYKQARRRDDDISIVTAAFNVVLEENNNLIKEVKLCFGGMAPTTICATKSSQKIVGMQWNKQLLNVVFESLSGELELDNSAPGGMAEYRKSLCLSLFFRFYLYVSQKLINGLTSSKTEICGVQEIRCGEPKSSQCFEIKNNDRKSYDTVGQPIIHTSALKQATGEAIYCDDMPIIEGELYLSLIFSDKSFAKINTVDASKALLEPGVVSFISAKDLPDECNKMGSIFKDEEIFSSQIVTSRACVIGAIIAKSESAARKAKQLVTVTYESLEPTVVSIEDAIKHESFFPGHPKTLSKGNIKQAIENAKYVREGYIRSAAQEHFYLETMSAFAVRKEDELEIIATTQNPAEIAHTVSETLRIPNHKVVAKVKRVGGGFGGKETRAAVLAVPVAIAAYKLKKPVRAVLDRDEDMQVTGYRHPILTKYKVAFNDDGKISGVIFDVYANAGNCMDISCAMIERVLCHLDNCYIIPNIEINAYLCKTNLPPNTAFRGFGAPKAMLAAECMIRDVAATLRKSYEEIVNLNMYQEGDRTHFNQALTYCTLSKCWKECIESSNYYERKAAIEEFNRCNRWKKKGISLVPTKYGISFQTDVLNQGGALLLVYNDGSILLSIGGIEMGQGLFTKMTQVASKALGVDISKIHISEMATDKVPNSSATAASISSDLYGMAIIDACNTIKQRLEPYRRLNEDGKWEDWVLAAYLDRVSLSATGFYALPKINYDRITNSGDLFEYFTYGVACSEVIIDCLTGDHQVLRTDIVMDLGESLNPAIDIGQIEGAFMQGYGFFTLEEMLFAPTGEVLTKGPGTYKIPGFSDIPKEFNVSLLKGAPNPRAVYSSKAVGEPPLFLAASVFFAIKEAIKAYREEQGICSEFVLEAPATCARIRMACEDKITQQVKPTIKSGGQPWNISV